MEFLQRFLSFDKLIAPTLITIFYWIGIAGVVLGCLASGVGMMSFNAGTGLLTIIVGIPLGIVLWRFITEVYMVIFGIYTRLGEIKDALGAKSTTTT
jgi:hypothetical protein